MPSINNLGSVFPNLAVETQLGAMNVYDYQGDSWLVFFSHPKDYTPGAWLLSLARQAPPLLFLRSACALTPPLPPCPPPLPPSLPPSLSVHH